MYFDSMTIGFLLTAGVIGGLFLLKWADLVPCDCGRLFKHSARYPYHPYKDDTK